MAKDHINMWYNYIPGLEDLWREDIRLLYSDNNCNTPIEHCPACQNTQHFEPLMFCMKILLLQPGIFLLPMSMIHLPDKMPLL